jgi:NAD(P)-dependent dehydrogenase (short-subunit alcohol dehydrogenase family)
MLDFCLAGQVIMITGGGSGIGRQTALLVARQRARVVVCDANGNAAKAVSEEVRSAGGEATAAVFDVTDQQATEAAVQDVESSFGPIDGLVAAAGISRPHRAEELPLDMWNTVIAVNLTGVFISCQAVGRRMIVRGRGAIVAIASGDAFGGHAGRAHYCASKYGVVGLVQTLAIEWGRHGVRVNATAPGAVDTPLLRGGVPADFIEDVMIDRTPMQRLASADDQAMSCLFLLSEGARFINGAVLPVDGGATAGYLTRWNGADYASNALASKGIYDPSRQR